MLYSFGLSSETIHIGFLHISAKMYVFGSFVSVHIQECCKRMFYDVSVDERLRGQGEVKGTCG